MERRNASNSFCLAVSSPLNIPPPIRAHPCKSSHPHWDKPVQEFTVSGDYAFERYDYKSTDTPVGGGRDVLDTGWGLVVYHRDSDEVWRVARDAFGPDHPAK